MWSKWHLFLSFYPFLWLHRGRQTRNPKYRKSILRELLHSEWEVVISNTPAIFSEGYSIHLLLLIAYQTFVLCSLILRCPRYPHVASCLLYGWQDELFDSYQIYCYLFVDWWRRTIDFFFGRYPSNEVNDFRNYLLPVNWHLFWQ